MARDRIFDADHLHSRMDGGADMAEKLIAWGIVFIVVCVIALILNEVV